MEDSSASNLKSNKYNDNHQEIRDVMKAKILILVSIFFLFLPFTGCKRNGSDMRETGAAITRSLEEAMELGKVVIAERALIRSAAITQGPEKALQLQDSLHHREHIKAFRDQMQVAKELSNSIDSTKDGVVYQQYKPILNKLDSIYALIPEL